MSKRISIGVCLLVLLFLVILGRLCGPELAISEYETNVNQITEIDASKRQAELNAIVEKGKMNVNFSSKSEQLVLEQHRQLDAHKYR